MARQKLSDLEIRSSLAALPGWEIKEGKLYKQYKFGTFAQAIGWMVAVSIYADKIDHHPEWCNVYNRVTIFLVTHDLDNSISNLDVELAQHMDSLAALFAQ
ncbi:Pterin-4-alpha-carbinolamine dehydratase [hydrothermal vent metagenome]|uniref:4a-hydroxytetrahydrobiopterin dehydratase n=1 Tax=hydrothermal vent metagenome TaxID=652676 RepID=A0A3B0V6R9_9ZZZZ